MNHRLVTVLALGMAQTLDRLAGARGQPERQPIA
jgi:hypothetical protein